MQPGEHCGPYTLQERLHVGGFASIWFATGPDDQPVALRFLRRKHTLHWRTRRRFLNGVHLQQRLEHPAILQCLGTGSLRLRPYAVLEYVSGRNLLGWLYGPDLRWMGYRRRVAHDVAEALDYIHSRGFLHLDVKPENILLSHGGDVRLTDFDTACAVHDAARMWRQPAGTPGYLAPELLAGDVPSVTSDIYAYGMLLRRLFPEKTGTPLDDFAAAATSPIPRDRPADFQEILAATAEEPPGTGDDFSLEALRAGP
jgi:serine/threonine protein kinase